MPRVNGKWVSIDDLLDQEFGSPENVRRMAEDELRLAAQRNLTGMTEEQAEWEGPPGDMHEPRGYTRTSSLDWPPTRQDDEWDWPVDAP